ncbi:hypothetical protein AVEN_242900-1 [Araneus ventricosus]|uniref:Uncharacterized protein n=1 Tax=Araneus ventricosus TaxID=182803 RepID=A0A4Y2H6A3_ARAVE|nr:hypothetical protein AVEN_242900-1 [Araneus ventricosus]
MRTPPFAISHRIFIHPTMDFPQQLQHEPMDVRISFYHMCNQFFKLFHQIKFARDMDLILSDDFDDIQALHQGHFVLLVNEALPNHVVSLDPLIYFETYSRRKALVDISWRHPPAHSWYHSEDPGATIHFKGDRKDQISLARLSSGHLKTLRFSRGDKKFNICTKCKMIEATPQHLLDCVALVYDDLFRRRGFVLEVMKANDLMDLI